MITVHFDLPHLYYLPQFMPVVQVLHSRGNEVSFTLYADSEALSVIQEAVNDEGLNFVVVDNEKKALQHYQHCKPDWIVFGNAPSDKYVKLKEEAIKLAFIYHGIGPKSCAYTASHFPFDVRFVEGDARKKRLQKMYPSSTFIDVGFAKLDPLFNDTEEMNSLESLDLDPNKKTLLYAPTFYPSSIECFSKDWPQELAEYNLIIKPHFFSLTKSKYAKQKAILEEWSKYENVYMCPVNDYSLIPFMQFADILLSEASSTVFEFAALDKPIVWCDFYQVRWNYRGLFKYRLNKRMDDDLKLFNLICERANSPSEVSSKIEYSLDNVEEKSELRSELTDAMAGKTDGQCSERIVEFLLTH
jgi:hypothetical protein